jgi:hypothetical protein
MAIKASQHKANASNQHSSASPFTPFPEPRTYPGQWDAAALQAPCRPASYGWQAQNQTQS